MIDLDVICDLVEITAILINQRLPAASVNGRSRQIISVRRITEDDVVSVSTVYSVVSGRIKGSLAAESSPIMALNCSGEVTLSAT